MTTPAPPPPPPPGFQPPGGPPPVEQPQGRTPAGAAYPSPYAAPPTQPADAPTPSQVRPPALPVEPVEYQHVLRGPRRSWWRPIAATGLLVPGFLVAVVGLLVLSTLGYLAMAGGDFSMDTFSEMSLDFNNPVTFGVQNLFLAALIPMVGLATWIAHGVRPGFVSSVLGRFRWGWFGWCLLVTLPLWLVYLGAAALVGGGGGSVDETAERPSTWVALLVLTLLTTPLQAAGEEYLFRGWLMQQVGAYLRNTYAALAVAILLSSSLFALAHTSLDPWVLLDLGIFATAAVLLTWRTGGLEAAVALHVINNVLVLVATVLTTGLQDAFITTETTSDPGTTLVSAVAFAVTTAVIWWLAGKRGVARRTAPAAPGHP